MDELGRPGAGARACGNLSSQPTCFTAFLPYALQLLVSIRRLEFQNAWDKVLASQVEDKAFDGEVIGVNRWVM